MTLFNWRKKLSSKVMLLVFIPLTFEVMLMLTLYYLLHQAEQDTMKAEKGRVIIAANEHMGKLLYDSGLDLQIYLQRRDAKWVQRYVDAVREMESTAERIKQLVAGNQLEEQAAAQLEKAMFVHLRSLALIKRYIDAGDMLRVMGVSTKIAQQSAGLGSVADAIERIIGYEEEHRVSPEQEERSRQTVMVCLFTGLIASVVIAVLLAKYLGQGTTDRLNVLMDNTRRLSRQQPLNPPVPGEDEISELDHVFRVMAGALAEASRKERAVVDNALDVICSISADGKFTRVNPAITKSWGYEPAEIVGRSFLEFVAKGDAEKSHGFVTEIITAKNDGTFENRIVRKDGSLLDLLWSAHWSESERSLFCVAHDITDRKEMERLKQDFVAMVSHDLRTPLTSIKGTLELLSDGMYGELSEQAKTRVTTAGRNTDRLIRLINDILDIEKMESGSLQLVKEVALMQELINRSVESVRNLAEIKNITIATPKNDAELVLDSDRVIQVLVNLLSNAIKFSPEDSTIAISLDSDDSWVTLRIKDNGRGIPPAQQESVFQRFKQVHVSDERQKGGSGLGLAISRAIIEAHGGQIGVVSEEGQGSTFWIKLPA